MGKPLGADMRRKGKIFEFDCFWHFSVILFFLSFLFAVGLLLERSKTHIASMYPRLLARSYDIFLSRFLKGYMSLPPVEGVDAEKRKAG